ncbi:hypothetical protein HID58_003371 [Brassica napus]|uniref:Uncharacterized protein n=3 Tax=Brassica TaxID=3705 RepID=A0ABQ8EQA0_BRANA|nr:hypothetical protein HID58_003371 [Brassica napus]
MATNSFNDRGSVSANKKVESNEKSAKRKRTNRIRGDKSKPMAKPNKSSTPSTHLSQYCNNSFENMRHDCFGDMSFVEEKLQMYTNQFELINSFSVGDNNKYQYSSSDQGSNSFDCS